MDLDQLYEAAKLQLEREQFEKWRFFKPVDKQKEFIRATKDYSEVMLMAGNGCGKTECAAYLTSRHLTGEYPRDWEGYKWEKPITLWAGGTDGKAVRDAAQTLLFGQPGNPEALGTGFIPREAIMGTPTAGRSAPHSIDSALIKTKIKGRLDESAISRIVFKTYEQGRVNWQGSTIDEVWYDEEPEKADVYPEGQARLRGRGRSITTFTPLFGQTDLVRWFMYNREGEPEYDPKRCLVRMALSEATWYTDEECQNMMNKYPLHERDARIYGIPMLGEGAVFRAPAQAIMVPPLPLAQVPQHWRKLWGIDFGIGKGHPFAAVLCAHDAEEDIFVVLKTVKMEMALALQHVHAMRSIAANVPVAWPHDGTQRDASSGETMAKIYKDLGLNMLAAHATHSSGGYSFEGGITALEAAMEAGKFKVCSDNFEWFVEYGSYHRKEGVVQKKNDDLMSATRIAYMMRRKASNAPFGARSIRQVKPRRSPPINPWTGRAEPVDSPVPNSRMDSGRWVSSSNPGPLRNR